MESQKNRDKGRIYAKIQATRAGRAKKGAEQRDCELLFVDETTLSLNYPLRSCWMKRGQQKEIPAFTGKRDYLHVIGAYNWMSAQITHLTVERKNSDTFIAFAE